MEKIKKASMVALLALVISACGGGEDSNQPALLPFPQFLFNFGNIGLNSDFWESTGCEGRNLRVAIGNFQSGCAMRDSNGCDAMPPTSLSSADCTWRTQGTTVEFSHQQVTIGNLVCMRSIAEIQRGNSNDVFFGRPSYGFGHITATPCEFRRTGGPM